MITVQCNVHFRVKRTGHKEVHEGTAPPEPVVGEGTIPRVARLMALAIRMNRLLREGVARDYADLARLGGVTRARMTQIMNLLMLAPDIQEQILFLPPTTHGYDPIGERQLRSITSVPDWHRQRRLFHELLVDQPLPCPPAAASVTTGS